MSRSQTAVRSSTADVRRTSSTDQRQVWSLLRLASSPTDVACYLVYFSSFDIASAVTVRGRSGVLPKLQGLRKPASFGEKIIGDNNHRRQRAPRFLESRRGMSPLFAFGTDASVRPV